MLFSLSGEAETLLDEALIPQEEFAVVDGEMLGKESNELRDESGEEAKTSRVSTGM